MKNGSLYVRASLMLSSAVALVGLATPALAQTATTDQPAQEAAAPAGAAQGDRLEDIIVTARKERESLQSTPISITAFSADSLNAKGITSISRIQDFTPNLTFANIPSNSGVASNAAIYIRGIGQSDFAPSVDPGVGTYVDGVYLGRSVGGVFDLIDVASVEVLRGPQGTLFGQNTIGGAVNITTIQPDGTFHVKGDIKYGTGNRINVRGMVSGPLTDGLYAKVSGGIFSQDGYVDAVNLGKKLGNQDYKLIRGALRFAPEGSPIDITLTGDYSRDKSNGAPVTITGIDAPPSSFLALSNFIASGLTNPNFCAAPAQANNPACYNARLFSRTKNYSTGPVYSDIEMWSASLVASYALSDTVQIKSISALRHTDGQFANDMDGSNIFISQVVDFFKQKQFSQELQLIGRTSDENLKFVGGLYYFEESGQDINPISFIVVQAQSGGYFDYHTWAGFGQLSYKITPQLTLTAGLRYSQVRKSFSPDQFVTSTLAPFLVIPPGTRIVPLGAVKADVNKLTPMVNLSYQASTDLMFYATFSQGFKGGGYTQRIFPPEPSLPSFQPETVSAYEAGFKLLTLGNRLRFNTAFFYTDYSDLQLLFADASRVGPFITNAGDARIWGFEAETNYALGDGWRVNASAGLTDAKYTRLAAGVQGLNLNSRFNYVSRWTVSGSLEKEIDLSGLGMLTAHGDWSYRSSFETNSNGLSHPDLFQPGYSVFNANLRWDDHSERYSLTVGIDNIADKKFRTFGDYQPPFGWVRQAFDRGRQYYVRAGINF